MNTLTRAARSYYRANVQVWDALRQSRINRLPVLVGLYLGVTVALSTSGHTAAAWVATVVIGLPLLVAGWAT